MISFFAFDSLFFESKKEWGEEKAAVVRKWGNIESGVLKCVCVDPLCPNQSEREYIILFQHI